MYYHRTNQLLSGTTFKKELMREMWTCTGCYWCPSQFFWPRPGTKAPLLRVLAAPRSGHSREVTPSLGSRHTVMTDDAGVSAVALFEGGTTLGGYSCFRVPCGIRLRLYFRRPISLPSFLHIPSCIPYAFTGCSWQPLSINHSTKVPVSGSAREFDLIQKLLMRLTETSDS